MSINKFGTDYLLLGLRVGKVIDGFVDAYYGPSELHDLVDKEEPQSPTSLIKACKNLQNQLNEQGFSKERVKYMKKTLKAIETSLNIISGKDFSFLEKVSKIYGIKPELIDDSEFYKLKEEINSIFEGSEELSNRIIAFKNKHNLPMDILKNTFEKASKVIRERTYNMFPDLLPVGESISIEIVKDKPWGAYNWYQGNFKSRIEINTDIPLDCMNVLSFITHEAYPGHHTEHSVKEKYLYKDQNRFEHSILMIFTPEAVVTEGIGNTAIDVLFTDQEKGQFILDRLCHKSSEANLDLIINYCQIQGELLKLLNNLAIHAHQDGWSDEELVKYALDFDLAPENLIRQRLQFIRHPLWSTYVFNYTYGEKLIKQNFGKNPSPEDFKKLLLNPFLPSDLI
ncbi:MAG: hypothetical protein ACFE9Z_05500 [Promethearchaeota archaeon]